MTQWEKVVNLCYKINSVEYSPAHGKSQLDSLPTLIWLNLFLEGNERTSVSVCADVVVGVEFKNSSLACCSFFWRISGECRLWSGCGFARDRSKVRFAFLLAFDVASSFDISSLSSFLVVSLIWLLGVKDNKLSWTESLRCGTVTCFFPQVITPTLADFWTSFRGPWKYRKEN